MSSMSRHPAGDTRQRGEMIERLGPSGIVVAMSGGRPFVGRERQRAELDAALAGALAGEGRLVFLSGEPGIGKTRLLDQAATAAGARGVRVAWGRCWESGAAPAYFPLQSALEALWRALPEEERGALATAETAAAGQLVPALAALVAAPPAEPDAARARFVLFGAVAALLRLASRRAPVMLALDDLHDADRSSLALLAYLARDLRSMAVLIVGTFRDVEARLSPEVGAELARIGREGVTLALPRLDRDESAALARALAGDVDGRATEALYRATQGNPLFIGEVLRASASTAELAAATSLPHSVRGSCASVWACCPRRPVPCWRRRRRWVTSSRRRPWPTRSAAPRPTSRPPSGQRPTRAWCPTPRGRGAGCASRTRCSARRCTAISRPRGGASCTPRSSAPSSAATRPIRARPSPSWPTTRSRPGRSTWRGP
jgi:hypothetical protein